MSASPSPKIADPKVHIPAAVKREAERAERLMREANGLPADPPNPDDPPAPPSDAAPAPAPAPAADAPAQPAADPAPPNATPKPNESPEDALRRMANEVNAANGRVRVAQEDARRERERADALERLLADIPTGVTPSSDNALEISPQDRETWGEDFYKQVEIVAKQRVAEATSGLLSEVSKLKAQMEAMGLKVTGATEKIEQTHLSDQRKRFLEDLFQRVGGIAEFERINKSDAFVNDFLNQIDDFTGQPLVELLQKADREHDAPRVAAFFNRFKQTEAPAASAPQAPGAGSPPATRPSLESFAAPGPSKAPATNVAPVQPPEQISRTDIAKFYIDKAAGRFKGREDDARKYEARIFEAQKTGNIINA